MRIVKIIVGLVLAAVTLPAPAQENAAGSHTLVGKVETIYVREARDLFYEKKLLRKTDGKQLWAEIRFADQLPDGSRGELAQLPANAAIERGDLVEIRVAGMMPRGLPLLPEVTHVTSLVAKNDTLQAMVFGLPNARPMKGVLVEAQACSSPFPTSVASAAAYTR